MDNMTMALADAFEQSQRDCQHSAQGWTDSERAYPGYQSTIPFNPERNLCKTGVFGDGARFQNISKLNSCFAASDSFL